MFMSLRIVNDETLEVIGRALRAARIQPALSRIPQWPGVSFEAHEDEFTALLGTRVLGLMTVSSGYLTDTM